MNLFNALFSTALFKASQDKFNRDKKKAQQTAYPSLREKILCNLHPQGMTETK